LIQSRVTIFKDSVPGVGWVKCFKNRHPQLAIRKAQALDHKRVKQLCPKNVESFYTNLQKVTDLHKYQANQV